MMSASTRAGVVRLNLGDAAQVRTVCAEILASAKAYVPQARIIDWSRTHSSPSTLPLGATLHSPYPTLIVHRASAAW